AAMLAIRLPDLRVNFDLAELRGYHYHTGVVFAAYQANSAQAIALGGRYDDIGEDFGYAQPATGFSLDLKKLVTQFPENGDSRDKISVVWADDNAQHDTVRSLREAGQIVIYDLPGQNSACNKQLIQQNGHWQVVTTGNVRG
ncbi:MAG: ATP phosphoribosyltransferase regulatory subunit, partial [Methylophaga sp.]